MEVQETPIFEHDRHSKFRGHFIEPIIWDAGDSIKPTITEIDKFHVFNLEELIF